MFEEMDIHNGRLSADMERIVNLPIKPDNNWEGWPVFDNLYRCGNHEDSPYKLNQLQRVALATLTHARGLLAMLPVGWGKTLLGLLCPRVVNASRPLYLTRSQNLETVEEQFKLFYPHFNIPDNFQFYGYEGHLSRAEFADVLSKYQPDCIVADEAHKLRRLESARSKRFVRYFQECEKNAQRPVCVVMGATFSTRGIKEYEHLSRIALRENSPLPFDSNELEAWASVLDAGMDALLGDFVQLQPLAGFNWNAGMVRRFGQANSTDIRENFREAFRRRLYTCPGVVTTTEPSVNCSLSIHHWGQVKNPSCIDDAINNLINFPELFGLLPPTDIQSPDDYDDYIQNFAMEKENQIRHGFYYTLDWPDGVVDMEYINARSKWGRLLAAELGAFSKAGYDSPALIVQAIKTGRQTNPDLVTAFRKWEKESVKPEPPRKIVWLSDFLIDHVNDWLHTRATNTENCIVWTHYTEFGERCARKLALPYHGAGSSKPTANCAVASIAAHGTGSNLQHYQRGLLTACAMGGAALEQLIGRWHRQGQLGDWCALDILLHTDRYKRKWSEAIEEAKYLQETTGQRQKILFADVIKEKGYFPNNDVR
jgi:hypothetical protein